MIHDIQNEEDFIRETEKFISKFEMYSINNIAPYSKPFSDLKKYFYQSFGNSYDPHPYLNLSYLYELLECISYVYVKIDKENDFLYSSLYNHLMILLKTDYISLDNDNSGEEEEEEEEYDDEDD